MELLIEEFLIHFPLILSLIIQSKLSIESSKGIYSIYLFTFPFLIINIITNDFPTTNQLTSNLHAFFCSFIYFSILINNSYQHLLLLFLLELKY